MDHRCVRYLGVLTIIVMVVSTSASAAAAVWATADESVAGSTARQCFMPASEQGSPDVVRTRLGEDAMVEKMKGEAALTHLYNLFSKRPQAFRAARKSLMDKGFEPTDNVYVERTVRFASDRSGHGDIEATPVESYSEQSSEGEIIFWSWDDGVDGTWEGVIYVEAYSTNEASSWEGQMDISDSNLPWIYYNNTWSGGGNGPGGDPLPVDGGEPPLPSQRPTVTFASWPPPSSYNGGIVQVGWIEWAECWRACVAGGCVAVAIGCGASGPLWPGCFGFGCLGVEVGCAVSCALSK